MDEEDVHPDSRKERERDSDEKRMVRQKKLL